MGASSERILPDLRIEFIKRLPFWRVYFCEPDEELDPP